jgi:uncharacterized membrane protein YgaE (UPF0421/DUF939 family)
MTFINNNAVVWKMPIASALSWELAKMAGSTHPYLAPLTVILSMQMTVSKSMKYAWQRVLGTIAGVLFTVIIAPYFGVSGWSIGLLLFIGAIIVQCFKLDYAVMVQVTISILLVMFFQSKMPSYPFDRIRDTVIGAVVAILIQMLIFPPDSINTAKTKMIHFADHFIKLLVNTAHWIERGCSSSEAQRMTTQLQNLFQELHQATTELDKASQSLNYNPLAQKKRHTLNQLNRQMEQLRAGFANLTDMIRVFKEWSDSNHFVAEDQRIWTGHLNNIALLVTEWKKTLEAPAPPLNPNALDLQIDAPTHLQSYQYPLALYMNAEQILQDFKSPVFTNKNL